LRQLGLVKRVEASLWLLKKLVNWLSQATKEIEQIVENIQIETVKWSEPWNWEQPGN